jgi:hypothetical protein
LLFVWKYVTSNNILTTRILVEFIFKKKNCDLSGMHNVLLVFWYAVILFFFTFNLKR